MNILLQTFSKQVKNKFFIASLFGIMPIAYHYKIQLKEYVKQWMRLSFISKQPKDSITTETHNYIESKKKPFLEFIKCKDINSDNIGKEFYNIDLYKEAIKEENNELEHIWRRRMLIEYTPKGNIYMFYDSYKLGFSYYSDTSTLSYDLLNAVAMKYCRLFHCTDFFVDQQVINKGDESPLIQIHHIEKPKKVEVKKTARITTDKAAFVSFKSNPNKKAETPDAELISNKFINLGRLYNMNILYKKPQPTPSFSSPLLDNLKGESGLQKDVMNYNKWKTSMANSNE